MRHEVVAHSVVSLCKVVGLSRAESLSQKFGKGLGKATVTGYCIKFKKLTDIKMDVLKSAIQFGIDQTS